MNTKLLVNGKLVKGKGDELGVLDPATGKVIAQVAEASEEQITAAVKAAAKAFPGWAATVPKDRSTLLLKLADRIEAEAMEFARLESQNCGKPLNAALNDEIPAIADVFRFFAGAARSDARCRGRRISARLHQHDPPRSHRRGRIHRALELSTHDGGLEDGSGAGRGQYRGAQALRADAAHRAQARDDLRGAVSRRRRQHHLRPRQHRGRAARSRNPKSR